MCSERLLTPEEIENLPDLEYLVQGVLPEKSVCVLDLPRDAREVIVLADGDEPGEAAAQDCARRWKREGRQVRIARPPQGMDFSDLLPARAPSIEEDAR